MTTNLSLSKRLHDLGYRGECEKWFYEGCCPDEEPKVFFAPPRIETGLIPNHHPMFPSPSVSEFFVIMPIGTSVIKNDAEGKPFHYVAEYALYYKFADSPADALAALEISLHENNIIDLRIL